MLLLVACAPATGARSPWFGTATMGTATGPQGNTFATSIIVHLGYTGNVTNLDVTVIGPNEYVRTEAITSRRSRVSMQEFHDRPAAPLASGTYVVHVTGSGGEQTWTIDVDATEALAPTTVTVVLTDPTEGRHTFAGLDLRVDGEYWSASWHSTASTGTTRAAHRVRSTPCSSNHRSSPRRRPTEARRGPNTASL